MKTFLKNIVFLIIFLLVIGAGICIYILQAPPVTQKEVTKLQIHTRTAIRGRPTVNSKPLVYTKDVYRFTMEPNYISNLNRRQIGSELLFTAGLAHRATLDPERLDIALQIATDWQKMFSDMTENIRFTQGEKPIEVLLSGEEWWLRDTAGAAYRVLKTDNVVNVYLPDLRQVFEVNKVSLSQDLEITVRQTDKRWLITDHGFKQTYSIVKGEDRLNVFQQSKLEIRTALFETDADSLRFLEKGKVGPEMMQAFVANKIPLSRQASVSQNADSTGWQIISELMKYDVRHEKGRLKVDLNLESHWLRVKVDDTTKGWVQRSRGTVFEPSPPTLSSRQQAKVHLLARINDLKARFGMSDEEAQEADAAASR